MTRPTDAAIARAFDWALVSLEAMTPWCTVYRRIKERAAEFDAESPAVVHTIPEKVTTSPERVQIPAESTHVRCPKCPAHMPAGLYCGGAQCPLRKS